MTVKAFVTQLYIASENQQLTNPSSPYYMPREQIDFLESGIGHDSKYPNGFSPWQAIMVYTHVLCLVEAAYRLYTDQQTQRVLNSSL